MKNVHIIQVKWAFSGHFKVFIISSYFILSDWSLSNDSGHSLPMCIVILQCLSEVTHFMLEIMQPAVHDV
jgi:hypothetical protein